MCIVLQIYKKIYEARSMVKTKRKLEQNARKKEAQVRNNPWIEVTNGADVRST